MKVTSMRGRDQDGPSMHLNEDHIRRLGLQPRAGDEVEFHGRAKVRAAGEHDSDDGVDRHAHLEITHLGAEHKGGISLRDELSEAAKAKSR